MRVALPAENVGSAARLIIAVTAVAAAGAFFVLAPVRAAEAQPSEAAVGAREVSRALIVRNNHEMPYAGAIEIPVTLSDGTFHNGAASAVVSNGVVRTFVSLAPHAEIRLLRTEQGLTRPLANGGFTVRPHAGRLSLQRGATSVSEVEFGLVVIPQTGGTVDSVAARFAALSIPWVTNADGSIAGTVSTGGYDIHLTAVPFSEGAIDMRARLVRSAATTASSYVALVRRVVTPGAGEARFRFNGREMNGGDSPDTWDRDFWYTHGVDWSTWRSGGVSVLSVNGFTPVPTVKRDSSWAEGSHFYVWERTRQRGDTMYLVSEIAGPNPEQVKSRYMPVMPYAPLGQGDTVALKWRLAVSAAPRADWAESQLRGFAGYRTAERRGNDVVVSIGVRSVMFGTSYFPYSTLAENFDYYRTPGLNSEGFWPMSPSMWAQWRKWIPKMRTDLHIARSMGFESVRLHHLELLRMMKRDEAFAFLDFFTGQATDLGLKVFIDTEGPSEWVTALLTRYRNVVTHVELENEVLIAGIKPADSARWSSLYHAAKAAAPNAQVFLTSAGNHAMFDRIRGMGVPFDRVGLHLYKHGPQWKEAFSSHVLGSAGYASDIGKPITIGEFNWKDLTRMSPEVRRGEFAKIYETVLEPRAIPEVMQFQFHETLTFNPAVAGSASRHYEPLYLDRRPKPEAFELMRLIREHGPAGSPVRELSIVVDETRMSNDRASAGFSITNNTSRNLTLDIGPVAAGGIQSRLATPGSVMLGAGATTRGRVNLELTHDKRTGTYHHFLKVKYAGKQAHGWGVASKQGAPVFSTQSVLGDKVHYPQGIDIVAKINWLRPLAVAFMTTATVLELESAYQLASTLQSATGTYVRLSSIADIPDSLMRTGTVILVGTGASNYSGVPGTLAEGLSKPGVGIIQLIHEPSRDLLLLTGSDARAVQAAAVEFQLRYWPTSKDAAIRITGMERGAALGNRAGGVTADPP